MPRKYKKRNTEADDVAAPSPNGSEQEATPPVEQQTEGVVDRDTSSGAGSRALRLSFNTTSDGAIDWESMRSKNKEQLVETLRSDPKVQSMFGPGVNQSFTNEEAGQLIGALGYVNGFIFQRVLKLDGPVAAMCFHFSDEDHAKLDAPTCAVLNKHKDRLPDWALRYKEELALVALVGNVTKNQMVRALQMQARVNQEKEQAEIATRREDSQVSPLSVVDEEESEFKPQ